MKHKEQSEYVDRTQGQYETALTRTLKIKTTLGHKFKSGNSMLKTGYSRRSNNNYDQKVDSVTTRVHWSCGSAFCRISYRLAVPL